VRSTPEDFDHFVATRTPALTRTAYLLTGDAHLAEDLVQTTLVKAAAAWERIEGDPEAYVRRILHHQRVSWWRRSQRRVREQALGAHDTPAPTRGDPELRVGLDAALGRLTARQREVLVLRYYEDLTETQTAAVLGIRPGTVKSIARQALARLRVEAGDLVAPEGGGVHG